MKTENYTVLKCRKSTYNLKNLCFVADFLNLKHNEETATTVEISKISGISPQILAYSFRDDDMQMAVLRKLFAGYGYKLDIEFVPINESETDKNVYIDKVNNCLVRKVGDMETKISVDFFGKNLEPLHYAMMKYSVSLAVLSEKTGTSRQVFINRFKADDCRFSVLVHIAKVMSWKILVDISKENA